MKATQGEWVVEYGAVYASSSESGALSRLLLADRDNPQTQPTERDANVLLAAEAVNFVRRLENVFGPSVDADERVKLILGWACRETLPIIGGVRMKLTIKELHMIAAALLRHQDNIPQESLPVLLSAHGKIIEALRKAKP